MRLLFLYLLLLPAGLVSCAITPDDAPVRINRDAIPAGARQPAPAPTRTAAPRSTAAATDYTPAPVKVQQLRWGSTPNATTSPTRKPATQVPHSPLSSQFRTPNLVDTLPSADDVSGASAPVQTIDDKVESVTTIRASE